jgi:hypothetical protein
MKIVTQKSQLVIDCTHDELSRKGASYREVKVKVEQEGDPDRFFDFGLDAEPEEQGHSEQEPSE